MQDLLTYFSVHEVDMERHLERGPAHHRARTCWGPRWLSASWPGLNDLNGSISSSEIPPKIPRFLRVKRVKRGLKSAQAWHPCGIGCHTPPTRRRRRTSCGAKASGKPGKNGWAYHGKFKTYGHHGMSCADFVDADGLVEGKLAENHVFFLQV